MWAMSRSQTHMGSVWVMSEAMHGQSTFLCHDSGPGKARWQPGPDEGRPAFHDSWSLLCPLSLCVLGVCCCFCLCLRQAITMHHRLTFQSCSLPSAGMAGMWHQADSGASFIRSLMLYRRMGKWQSSPPTVTSLLPLSLDDF